MGKEVEIQTDWPTWKIEIAGALNSTGLSMKEASVKAGLGETFVRDALKRDRKPGHENLMKLFSALGLSTEALLPNVRPVVGLEVVGVTEAGAFRDATLSHKRRSMLDTIPVAKDPRYDHANQYALLVTGDSMDKIIEDGCFVTCVNFADTGLQFVVGMILHVERHQGALVETTIKRYAEAKGKRWLMPESNNPEHKPIEINGDEATEIIVKGLVLGTWKPISY